MAKSTLDIVAMILVIVGGLNWGLVAFDINLVDMLLGSIQPLPQIVYALVGLSALYVAYKEFA